VCIVAPALRRHARRFTARAVACAPWAPWQVMAFGVVPVVVSDDWALPFEEVIDWGALSLRVREDDAEFERLPSRLASVSINRLCTMRGYVFDTYHRFLRSPKEWNTALADVLQHRAAKSLDNRGTIFNHNGPREEN
jgi:hypothetical protein